MSPHQQQHHPPPPRHYLPLTILILILSLVITIMADVMLLVKRTTVMEVTKTVTTLSAAFPAAPRSRLHSDGPSGQDRHRRRFRAYLFALVSAGLVLPSQPGRPAALPGHDDGSGYLLAGHRDRRIRRGKGSQQEHRLGHSLLALCHARCRRRRARRGRRRAVETQMAMADGAAALEVPIPDLLICRLRHCQPLGSPIEPVDAVSDYASRCR